MKYQSIDPGRSGIRIRALRTARGESGAALAKAVGVSASAVEMYENGKRIPRDEIKIRIAEHYQTPVEDIFYRLMHE